jgi:hypothetical protein
VYVPSARAIARSWTRSWDPGEERATAVTARGLRERGGEVALADAGLADDDHVEPVVDPAAGGEVADDGLVEAAAGVAADILEAGVVADLGGLEQGIAGMRSAAAPS